MDFLEKDLEEIIFNSDKDILMRRGLDIKGVVKRQLRIGNYGIADLVYFSKSYAYSDNEHKIIPILNIDVLELKKDEINMLTFMQAVRYCKGLSRWFYEHRCSNINIKFNIKLVGRSINNKEDVLYLSDLIYSEGNHSISKVNFYTYKYEIDGLYFNSHSNYCLKNEGF